MKNSLHRIKEFSREAVQHNTTKEQRHKNKYSFIASPVRSSAEKLTVLAESLQN